MIEFKWPFSAALGLLLQFPAQAEPRFSLPVDCVIGPGCQVQNYPDDDAGTTARDFACGTLTYDGHKGTDIRLRDLVAMHAGVKVLAAAAGTVKAVRDDMADISVREPGAASVAGRECGNGVVLDHGEGWVTQYCHMRRGSIRVKPGEQVVQGDALGLVGLSGSTEFVHVHFEVRKGSAIINPFTAMQQGTAACGSPATSMWDNRTAQALGYKPAAFLAGGFSGAPVGLNEMEKAPPAAPQSTSAALVAYVRILGVRAGDIETLTITGPDGPNFISKGPEALAKTKVHWLSFAGRKRTAASWPKGNYTANYSLTRNGETIINQRFSMSLR